MPQGFEGTERNDDNAGEQGLSSLDTSAPDNSSSATADALGAAAVAAAEDQD